LPPVVWLAGNNLVTEGGDTIDVLVPSLSGVLLLVTPRPGDVTVSTLSGVLLLDATVVVVVVVVLVGPRGASGAAEDATAGLDRVVVPINAGGPPSAAIALVATVTAGDA